MDPVTVLLVDDSAFVREGLRALLASESRVRIAGEACDGSQAVRLVRELRPQIVTMDINMPVMDGFEAIKQIMSTTPVPILVLSSVQESSLAFRAISLGALEVMEKPRLSDSAREMLVSRLLFLARVKVIRHVRESREGFAVSAMQSDGTDAAVSGSGDNSPPLALGEEPADCVVAIASSTGGPKALATVLGELPGDLPAAVVVAQHIGVGFSEALASWLDHSCPLRVVVASEGMRLARSMVYIAPDRMHISVGPGGTVVLAVPAETDMYVPCADRLLASAAAFARGAAIGVVLTGMGRDGSEGVTGMRRVHGWTIAQDEATSIVFGMPSAAIATGCVDVVAPLQRIASEITNRVRMVAR